MGTVFLGEGEGATIGVPTEADEVSGVGLAGEGHEILGDGGKELGGATQQAGIGGEKRDVGGGFPSDGAVRVATQNAWYAPGEQGGNKGRFGGGRERAFKVEVANRAEAGDGELGLLKGREPGAVEGAGGTARVAGEAEERGVSGVVLRARGGGGGLALGGAEAGPMEAEQAL